jgi:hypothetical protein
VWIACLLMGHDDMLVRAPGRLWLRCADCGRETPGWSVGRAAAPAGHERRPAPADDVCAVKDKIRHRKKGSHPVPA